VSRSALSGRNKSHIPPAGCRPRINDAPPVLINAVDVAAKVGNSKVYNMAVLGGYLKMKPVVKMENVEKGLQKSIPARYSDLIALNKSAIEEGMKSVEML
jgi:2-oxoglutarate ferredoxin oxidoreductase subunit gamma